MTIIIALPVWGERYVRICRERALPSIRRAAQGLDVRIALHTNEPHLWPDVDTCPLPLQPTWWQIMSQVHRQSIVRAGRGDIVVLWTADMVMSPETLAVCQQRLEQYGMVAAASMRVRDDVSMPEFENSRQMLAWAWANRHPMVVECTWPNGRSQDMTRLFFDEEGRIVSSQLFPHPVAVRADGRAIKFYPTVDCNLIRCFNVEEIYLVTDPDEMAVFELSPPDKEFELSPVRLYERPPPKIAHPIHREMSRRKITICEER